MDKIEIYTASTCGYCKTLKDELTKNNIEFEEKLTTDFKNEYQAIVNLTGLATTPTIKYEGEYFIPGRDFHNAGQVIDMTKHFQNSKFNIEKQLIEKIKTLTYHMQTAFGRTDQILRQIESKLNKEE